MSSQRICLKFCVKSEIKCSEAVKMLRKAFGDATMSIPRAYEWYKRFQEGRQDVEDDARSGRPSTSITEDNIAKIKDIILCNGRITIREAAQETGFHMDLVKPFLLTF